MSSVIEILEPKAAAELIASERLLRTQRQKALTASGAKSFEGVYVESGKPKSVLNGTD